RGVSGRQRNAERGWHPDRHGHESRNGATQSVTQTIQLPVASASATCHILHLELGPLDLMLLGLNVHLDRVVLDITATSGPGNLLGNLLCGVAHLLDGSGSLTGLANALNNIIALL